MNSMQRQNGQDFAWIVRENGVDITCESKVEAEMAAMSFAYRVEKNAWPVLILSWKDREVGTVGSREEMLSLPELTYELIESEAS